MDINEGIKLLEKIEALGLVQGEKKPETLNDMVGHSVIIRTFSAGVWFGILDQKQGNEVILRHARRMWRWWATKSISLSAVALYGINVDKSKIAPAVPQAWLEAIEIIPCSEEAINSLRGAPDVEAR